MLDGIYLWMFEDAIEAGVCSDVSFCIAHYQTLLSGMVAVLAAIVTAVLVYYSATVPVREQRRKDHEQKEQIKAIIELEFKEEMKLVAKRARAIKGSIITYRASDVQVNDDNRKRLFLPESDLVTQRELMSLQDRNTVARFLSLMSLVYAHQQNIRDTGSFVDDNYYNQINGRLDLIRSIALTLAGAAVNIDE
ncbi:hypothetical protein [Kiloniella laminariae]|uniref:hypothetical protein n=1 Tax=Kiloniella laminariae TaxID=454162 RepID=UPI00037ABD0D|nr:hypothetical protein [Kiloniella laminariae]